MNADPRGVQRRIADGLAAWERHDLAEALAIFDEVLAEHPDFPDVHNRRGLCLALLGRSVDAEAAFAEATRIAPGYAEAHLNRGIVQQELGDHEGAGISLAEAERLDHRKGSAYPSDLGNQLAITHAKAGDLYLVADRPELAAEQYAAALEVRPWFLDIRTKLAEALIDQGALERAREELEKVLDQNSDFAGARLRLGVVFNRIGDRERAIEEWKLCVLANPKDMRPKAYLASVGVTDFARLTSGSDRSAAGEEV